MPFNAKAEDDVKASDPQTPLPKTRSKYVKNACTNCRKASRKCDDARPCPRCIKYALEDSCVSYVRRKRPEKKNGKNQKAIQKQKQVQSEASSSSSDEMTSGLEILTTPGAEFSQVLQGAVQAFKQCNFDQVENCLRDALLVVLHQRIDTLYQSRSLDEAMDAAITVINLYPRLPTGYQWAGDICCDKCDYKTAIEYYTRGIAKTESETLTQCLHAATTRYHVRLDPLACLPSELIARIFDFCPEKRIVCFRLSRSWQQKLPHIPMWSTLDVALTNKRKTRHWQVGLSRVLGKGLRELTLKTCKPLCTVVDLLGQAECINLGKIVVDDTTRYDNVEYRSDSTFRDDTLFRNLELIGGNLTHLQIKSPMLPRNVLPVFLALFPRLVHLSYDVADKNQQEMAPWDYSMLAAPSVTDLVYLRWPDLVDLASVTDLLPRCCPRLGSLVVSCPADFQQHDISRLMESTLACPDMQVIRFQAGSLPANDPQDEPQPNVSGLRRLVVCQQAFVNLAVMSRILRAHEQTLVEFKCDETGHFDFIDVHHAPAVSLHMPALTRVQLSSSIPNVIRPFSAFLANAPGLIELVLNRMTIDDEIMTAIARLPRLQHLTFNKCRGDTDLLSLLVRESIDKGADCTLTSLCVRDASANMMWDEDVFIDMALIMTLHHIEVSAAVSDRRTLSSFAIRSFTENATRSGLANHLETLVLPVPKRNPNIRHLLSSSCQPLTSLKLIST